MPATFADPGAHDVIRNGKTTVTTAGTRVQLSTTSTGIHSVVIRALSGNTGTIYIGNSGVSSSNGITLEKGDSLTLTVRNLNLIYVDASVNGDSVTYIAT